MVAATDSGVAPMDHQSMPAPGAIVPVGPVKSVLPTPNLAGLKLETQTRAIGVIQPPPDIRAIVDKTAQFVAKNGMLVQIKGQLHFQDSRTEVGMSYRHSV